MTGAPSGGDATYARRLGLFSGTMLVVGGIIGSGIFLNPSIVARRAGTAGLHVALVTHDATFDQDARRQQCCELGCIFLLRIRGTNDAALGQQVLQVFALHRHEPAGVFQRLDQDRASALRDGSRKTAVRRRLVLAGLVAEAIDRRDDASFGRRKANQVPAAFRCGCELRFAGNDSGRRIHGKSCAAAQHHYGSQPANRQAMDHQVHGAIFLH